MKTIAVHNSGSRMFPKLMSKDKRNKTKTQKNHCQDVIRMQEDRNTDKAKSK